MSEKYNIPKTRFHRLLTVLSLLALAFLVLYPAFCWNSMPDIIPTHYNIKGEADGWGSKGSIWLLPIIGCLLYLLLTFVSHNPSIWNLPACTTAQNKKWVLLNMKNLILVLRLLVVVMFTFLNYRSVHSLDVGIFFLLVSMAAMFGSMLVYSIRCRKMPPDYAKSQEDNQFDGF